MKISIEKNKKTVLFLCTPSLVTLDSWISVLVKLRERLPDAQFIFIIPRAKIINTIKLDSILIKLAASIFDFIVFKSSNNIWMCTKKFKEVKDIYFRSKNDFNRFLIKFLEKIKLKNIANFFEKNDKLKICHIFRNNLFKLDTLNEINYFTLFDIYELNKPYNKELHKFIVNRNNFSLKHGSVPEISFDNTRYEKIDFNKTTLFALSKLEIQHYKNSYGLKSDQIKVYGNPKHDQNWIEHILDLHKSDVINEKYIFIISRPDTKYLPIHKKKLFLQIIKSVADKLNLKVIVKLHPKELNFAIYEKIFGLNNFKKKWDISYIHHFVLGKNCEFAVSFYSGIPIDLIKLGTPCIELLDLKDIKEYDNQNILRDFNNEPVFNVRYLNLVLGASTLDEFEKNVNYILNDKYSVIKKLKNNYDKVFPNFKEINILIVDEICSKITNNI